MASTYWLVFTLLAPNVCNSMVILLIAFRHLGVVSWGPRLLSALAGKHIPVLPCTKWWIVVIPFLHRVSMSASMVGWLAQMSRASCGVSIVVTRVLPMLLL